MRFLALRIVQWIFYLMGMLWAIVGLMAAFGQEAALQEQGVALPPQAQAMGMAWLLLFVAFGVLVNFAIGQVIGVVLAIEENTRQAAEALKQRQ
jgi:hypothetical protein